MKNNFIILLTLLLCGGCATANLSDDGETAKDALAHIRGDYRVTAGLPVTLTLRSVDGKALKFWQSAADVSSGQHRLLVDCRVAATEKLGRYELNVTVHAGEHYGFSAEATPRQGCTEVKFVNKD
ncbi:MAG: hypothetical protein ABUL58_06785 [Steroidobacter sp.]